ncbi:hypothetical protein [Streptomyces sp. NPDC058731]|uniref:hypothetical protein n=1 Tax=Streptomyces sp. NPDC058731 TaxID=3346613 RepID=UPI0036C72BE1
MERGPDHWHGEHLVGLVHAMAGSRLIAQPTTAPATTPARLRDVGERLVAADQQPPGQAGGGERYSG